MPDNDLLFDQSPEEKLRKWAFKNKFLLLALSAGFLLLVAGGSVLVRPLFEGEKIEVLESLSSASVQGAEREVLVEIAGAVEKPGVYKLLASDRVERLLIASGGLSSAADREWVGKNLNQAAKLLDGQKIYIPKKGETTVYGPQSTVKGASAVVGSQSTVVNINTASLSDLDTLPGIGVTRAQAIIDNRPYASIDELLSKKVLPKSVLEKIKDRITAP